jgi:hypothetical protein
MKYNKPNFSYEWKEARRYPEFKKMGKDAWVGFASKNFEIASYKSIKDHLGNVDLNFDSLDENKKKRFETAFNNGEVEIPVAVKFGKDNYDLVGGNTRLAGLIKNNINPKLWVIDLTNHESYEPISDNFTSAIVLDKKEFQEETGADSSGSFSGPIMTNVIKKKDIMKMPNTKEYEVEQDMREVTDSSSSGAYDVPFGNGGKNPLAINGVKSIAQSRAVKDPKFPKWGGPDAVFVKVKEKCKKFPYCNEGPGAIEMYEQIDGLNEAIEQTAKKYNLTIKEVRNLVSNEIKQIFI